MNPVLFQAGGVDVPAYGVFVLLGVLVAWRIRRAEVLRLGHARLPGFPWVSVGALLGAVAGAKLGMVLFTPAAALPGLLAAALSLDFTGKTVVGGLAGGYLGVELAKAAVGITRSTGDGFAVALPVAQGIGRIGCLMHGCCFGTTWDGPWAVAVAGILRHPAPLYEAALDLALAAWLWSIRGRSGPAGHLFKRYLAGYGLIRFAVEFLRGDPSVVWGPMKAVQWVCLAAFVGFGLQVWRGQPPRSGSRSSFSSSPR